MQNEYQGSNVVFIDKARVQQGLIMAKAGQQQLPQIPERKTLYYFTVSQNNHCSVCEIFITPIKHTQYPNFFFFPVRRYTRCCDIAPRSGLSQQHQAIYDVLIRPNQWRFSDDDSDEVMLPWNASTVGICHHHSELGLNYLLQTATLTSSGASKDVAFPMTSESPCRCTDVADETNSSDTNGTMPHLRKKRKDAKNAADTISKKLLKAAEVKIPGSFKTVSEMHSLSNVEQPNALPILTTYEERLEFAETLRKLHSKTHDRAGQIIWANKRYSLDMRFLLRRERKIDGENEADRSARSSMLINRIASKLSDNNPECYCGVQVYDLFAKAGHLLTNRAGHQLERLKIADMIAESIRSELPPLHGPTTIFYAPAVIADLWKKDYATICKDLDAEHLALHDVVKHVVKVPYDDDLYTYGVHLDKGCPVHGGQNGHMASRNSLSYRDTSGIDALGVFDNSEQNMNANGAGSLGELGITPFGADSFWDFLNSTPDNRQPIS